MPFSNTKLYRHQACKAAALTLWRVGVPVKYMSCLVTRVVDFEDELDRERTREIQNRHRNQILFVQGCRIHLDDAFFRAKHRELAFLQNMTRSKYARFKRYINRLCLSEQFLLEQSENKRVDNLLTAALRLYYPVPEGRRWDVRPRQDFLLQLTGMYATLISKMEVNRISSILELTDPDPTPVPETSDVANDKNIEDSQPKLRPEPLILKQDQTERQSKTRPELLILKQDRTERQRVNRPKPLKTKKVKPSHRPMPIPTQPIEVLAERLWVF